MPGFSAEHVLFEHVRLCLDPLGMKEQSFSSFSASAQLRQMLCHLQPSYQPAVNWIFCPLHCTLNSLPTSGKQNLKYC